MQALYDKIDELNREAYSIIYTDISRADKLATEARELSSDLNYTRGFAWTLLISGLLEMEQGVLEQASGRLFQAHHIFLDIGSDKKGIAASLNALGLVCIRQAKMKEAFSHLKNALSMSKEFDLKDVEFKAVNLLGILQFHMENYNQALRFFKKAMKLITVEQMSGILNNLGCCYRALGKYDQALDHLKRALTEAEKSQIEDTQIPILEEIGLTYGKIAQYDEGIEILQDALSRCSDYHKRYKLSINIKLGELYIKKEDYQSAERVLNEARDYITFSNSINNRSLYQYLSVLSEMKGDYKKALIHYKNYHLLTGKIKSTDLDEKIWNMETESFQEKNRRIRKIGEMGKRLTALLDRDQVIETLFQSVKSIFDVDYFAIGLSRGDQKKLELEVFDGKGTKYSEAQVDTSQPCNPESWVAVHRTGIIFNNLKEDYCSYFPELDSLLPDENISSVLCLPFDSGARKGLIAIYSDRKSAFNREDYEILELLNSYATIALSNARQTKVIRETNRELEKLNKFDDLTGIYNRKQFLRDLEKMWKICSRSRKEIHLLLIDVDHFKRINDTLGHSAGDFCLQHLGQQFRQLLQRSSDLYARYGGEEFIVALQDLSIEEAGEMAEKIRETVESQSIEWEGHPINLTVSLGLCSTIPPEKELPDLDKIINQADKNMYESKTKGRNQLTSSQF